MWQQWWELKWDCIARTVAWWLPPRVVYHASIYLVAWATTGRYGSTVVSELSAMDAIQRYGQDRLPKSWKGEQNA